MKKTKPKSETYILAKSTVSTALEVLSGMLDGITCDHEVNDLERAKVDDWISRYSFLSDHPAFGSVLDYLAEALADGVLTVSEAEDLKWMLKRNKVAFYDDVSEKIQNLMGLASGISADGEINSIEKTYLWEWLNENENLKGIFPYDEIYSIILQVGIKNTISSHQTKYLVDIFQGLTNGKSISPDNPFVPWSIDPDIAFNGKTFCLTGISQRMPRREIIRKITNRGGKVLSGVSGNLDYLIICTEANVAWTHSCYGRKVEQAIKLRRERAKVQIIAEKDFWDQLQD